MIEGEEVSEVEEEVEDDVEVGAWRTTPTSSRPDI
jgi:hypothetical protein